MPTPYFDGVHHTDVSIRTAVAAWLSDASAAEATYGHISTWATGGVTDMENLFCAVSPSSLCNSAAASFNEDIGAWDTSGVKSMAYMFKYAAAFNQDVSGWDTSSVLTMEQMFAYAPKFDQPLQSWDVSRVTSMAQIFNRATAFNQDLGWCVSADLTDAFVGTRCGSYDCGVSSPPSCVP